MFKIIEKYMYNLKIEDLNNLALKNDLFLSDDELNFSYSFIKKNWEIYLTNPQSFNMDKYKNYYSNENFIKIKKLYATLFSKYSRFL